MKAQLELKEKADNTYYNGEPIMTDAEYDALIRSLKEKGYRPITVGAPVGTKQLAKVKHLQPLYSLDNAFDEKDMGKWLRTIPNDASLTCEYKFDGLALSLIYEKGKLVCAATRGDGRIGENVTEAAKVTMGIPHELKGDVPDLFEVRGEVVFFHSNFQRAIEDGATYSNPRNAAAGILRSHDIALIKKRGLDFFAYQTTMEGFATHSECLEYLTSLGFRVSDLLTTTPAGVEKAYQDFIELREDLPYDIDGMVVKVNDLHLQEEMGFTSHCPLWAKAYKFPHQEYPSVLRDVFWSVGRTGTITPVAQFDPIDFGGVRVRQATLHNLDELERLQIEINDQLWVRRSGDVIPKITRSIRTDQSTPIELPTACPGCNAPVRKEGVALQCTNTECVAVVKAKLSHACSRQALDVRGLGDDLIGRLVDHGSLTTISSVFELNEDKLTAVGLSAYQASKILDAIESAKDTTFIQFIYCLGLNQMGYSNARILAQLTLCDSIILSALPLLKFQQTFGANRGAQIYHHLHDPLVEKEMKALISAGVKWPTSSALVSDKLKGTTWVVTGSFEGLNRSWIEELIRSHGGKVGSSVSKKTTTLLAGDNAGSKLAAAKALGIEVVSLTALEERFAK